MREIKFRGWKMYYGGWVYGSLIYDKDKTWSNIVDEDGVEHVVETSSVGQYTGLKDRKGVEIFDGDIVQHGYFNTYSREKLTAKYTVTWGRCGFGTVLVCITEQEFCEVIGNIYDNPELLGGQE